VQQQKIIGLTGGIGSGKSTIARMARILGFPVYDADNEVKKLYTEYPELRAAISELFGRDVFTNDQLNRSLLASRIFDTKDGKEKIGHLIQPYLLQIL
jgi:dephospho-CoA kinase